MTKASKALTLRKRVCIRQFLLFLAVTIVYASAHADESPFFTIRTSGPIAPETSELLAKIAKPREVSVQKGADLTPLIEQICGGVNDDYVALLKRTNPSLADSTAPDKMIVKFPACFYVKPGPAVIVKPGDNLSKIAESAVGAAGVQTIGDIINKNALKARSSKSGTVPKDVPLKPGQQLTLPYATEAVRYEIDLDAVPNVPAALTELQRTAKNNAPAQAIPLPEAGPSNDERLLVAVEVGAKPQSGPPCAGKGVTSPFDLSKLIAILSRNLLEMEKYGLQPEQISVAVVDTGLDGFGGKVFPRAAFDLNRIELEGAIDQDNDGNGYIHDVYGVNVYDKSKEPLAFRNYYGGPHGTHVAGLIRGGIAADPTISSRIKLKIINVVQETIRGSATGPVTTYSSPPGGLDFAVEYAAKQKASVVNVSFAAASHTPGIEQYLHSNPGILLVASAGNDNGTDLDRQPIYPAAYGGAEGDFRDQVISVAAHDGDFAPASFTNVGANRVDLAAPGCDIASYGFDGSELHYSGTSQAAPFVTLTAALLMSEGLHPPRLVKNRILASVDIRPTFHGKIMPPGPPLTRSEGTLNILKALSVNDDILELKEKPGVILPGRLVTHGQRIRVCANQEPLDLPALLKASPNYLNNPKLLRYLIKDVEGKPSFRTCDASDDTVEFIPIGEDTPKTLHWQDILDFVPAQFKPAENTNPYPPSRLTPR